MNMRMMNTVPRKLRLAASTASTTWPSSTGALIDSARNTGVLNAPRSEPGGSDRVQSMMPTDSAVNPASWLRTPSTGPAVR